MRAILLSFLSALFLAKADFFFLFTLGLSYPRRLLVSPRTPDLCTCFLNLFKALSKGSFSLTTIPGIYAISFLGRLRAETTQDSIVSAIGDLRRPMNRRSKA